MFGDLEKMFGVYGCLCERVNLFFCFFSGKIIFCWEEVEGNKLINVLFFLRNIVYY